LKNRNKMYTGHNTSRWPKSEYFLLLIFLETARELCSL
jgi:hypothetical protein